MAGKLTLTIVTPSGVSASLPCDSIRFDTPDGVKKSNPGGSIGIRHGHTDALIAVAEGPVLALLDGKTVLSGRVSAGFAAVRNGDTVSLLTDRFSPAEDTGGKTKSYKIND